MKRNIKIRSFSTSTKSLIHKTFQGNNNASVPLLVKLKSYPTHLCTVRASESLSVVYIFIPNILCTISSSANFRKPGLAQIAIWVDAMRASRQEFRIYRPIWAQMRANYVRQGVDKYRMIVRCSGSPYLFDAQLQKKISIKNIYFLHNTNNNENILYDFTSLARSWQYSMSISWRVSMCSLTKAIGTKMKSFFPCFTYSFIASSVNGASQGNGPTLKFF